MEARQSLQAKQRAIAAIRAQQYDEAISILNQLRDASPGDTLADPLVAELLSTLQQKVAQDAAALSAEEAEDGDTSSAEGDESDGDDDDSEACSSTSASDPGSERSVSPAAGDAAGDALRPTTPGSTAAGAQQQAAPNAHAQPPSSMQATPKQEQAQLLHATAGIGETAGDQPGSCGSSHVGSIQLAPGSCSLTPSDHGRLRQQLLAGLEAERAAAALDKVMAGDPLLSSLTLG